MKVYRFMIYRYQLESIIIMLLCVDVTYLNGIFHVLPSVQYYGRCVLLLYLLLNTIHNKKHISRTLKVISLFTLWILVITYIRGGDIIEAFKVFSSPLILCIYADQKRNSTKIYDCLSVWKNTLFVFVLIDFATQIIFPNGMYGDSMYSLNWFLGYKTSRLSFSLPLCVFASIVDMNKRGRLTWRSWICFILSMVTLFYSQATAASVAIAILSILIVLICINRKGVFTERLWEKLLNLKIVLVLYTVLSILVVYAQNSPQIQYILVNILHKDPTLTTRTYIWNLCITSLQKHPFTGLGYLNSLSYQNLTNNVYATSAHNMSLSILISGGFIGLIIYITIIIVAWKSFNKNASIEKKISSIAVIALLIVGMTSSSLVYSTCAFIFYELMEILSINHINKTVIMGNRNSY
ncbi:O-antigen ligase family protein [Anaerobutyricum hallii]|uniref:O-antigen ligase family protein n=1 Tax=Anaerobutyricum hallii TaxID=39488 RepID=UPI002A81617D|nr:O-antigen ligase family protein [Anaerobutyricum hallii]